ncbi:MAG TPA: hypothetical protein EYG02_12255 [Henriciella marina]|uniref:hypothetical protein n=1 Tax=Henriciella sp. TaxID=1968823 RepID=UPI0017C32F04|nr:hypothetical protein [Henriciella sp.]HIG23056.1 hypothetical protein [Henriciella sp.]HIK65783.1 hypothetical protein [Henriciella marina]
MSVPRSRFTKITLALIAGFTFTAPVLAQNAQTYVANGRYATDYEVGSWPDSDRARQTDYLEQQYMASDELLGGPVAKPGEPRFGRAAVAEVGKIRPELRLASAGGDFGGGTAAPVQPSEPTAGMRVESIYGEDIGSVAMVQSDDGDVDAVWVRITTGATTDLVQVTRERFDVEAGRIIVSG